METHEDIMKEFEATKKVRAWAICKKTYPDEDDMQAFCDGDIEEASDVRVYHKGRKYLVDPVHADPEYYAVIDS